MPETLKKLGLTPTKAALIVVLVGALAAVWGPQLMRSVGGPARPKLETAKRARPSRTARKPTPPATPRPQARSAQPPATAPTANDASAAMRTYTVAEASDHDPFAVPAWSPKAAEAVANAEAPDDPEAQARADNLRAAGVQMVLVSSGGHAAVIGDRFVRVGDEIDGYRVAEITTEGVVLEPVGPGPPGDADG